MISKRIWQSAKKRLFKKIKLCYSVEEAVELDVFRSARCTSSRSDWYNLRFNQFYDFRWSYRTPEELSAYVYSCGKVCLVNILAVFFLNDYVRGNQFRKVVHNQPGKNLLGNVLHLFCVEMKQSNSVF